MPDHFYRIIQVAGSSEKGIGHGSHASERETDGEGGSLLLAI